MRSVRALGIGLLLALVGVACGGGDSATDQALTVGIGADENVVGGPANLGQGSNIAETLIALTPRYELQPLLAERWELRPPNTWRFFLRRGVSFHDGQPLDAQAVKVGLFDRVTEFGTTIGAGPDSAVVVDEYTIDFTPAEQNRRVPQQLVHPRYGVLAPGTDAGNRPVGTGPFRFAEYAPEQHLVVERYDGYWGAKAKSDRVTFRFIPDVRSRQLSLETGEIDVAAQVSPTAAQELEAKGFQVVNSPVGAYDAMYANIHKPNGILSDLGVRQAVASAVNRKAIADQLLEGRATADPTMVPPGVLGEDASLVKGHSYDPARARALLDDAGWAPGGDGVRQKGGRRLDLTLAVGPPESLHDLAVVVQSQLRDVGVDLEIVERSDPEAYIALVASGEGDLYLEEGNQNDADPAFLPSILFYSQAKAEEVNYPALFAPGPQFDQALAPALTEDDPTKVRRAVAEAMHQIVDQEAVVIPLAAIYGIYGLDEDVEGFVAHPSFVSTRWDQVSR